MRFQPRNYCGASLGNGVTRARNLSRRRLLGVAGTLGMLSACGESPSSNLSPAPSVSVQTNEFPLTPAASVPTSTAQVARATPVLATAVTPLAKPKAKPGAVTPPADVDDGLRRLDGYGFQVHMYNQDRRSITEAAVTAGFDWVKQQVEWRQTEPMEKGGFDWRELDKVVAAASGAGLKILLSVVQAPDWALGDRSYGPPGDPLDFKDFMAAIAGRYRGRVQAYELWNEANLSREWGYGRLNAGEFVELLNAGHRGVKQADADAVTVGGALTPAGDVDIPDQNIQAIDDVRFLEEMYAYREGLVRESFDAWGVHPGGFNNAPTQEIGMPRGAGWNGHGSFYFQRFSQHRAVMKANGDADKAIWLTEFGWSTKNVDPGYGFGGDNSEDDQATFLVDAFRIVRQDAPYISHAFVWNLNFQSVVAPEDEKYPFGVLGPDGVPRPAYSALVTMPKGIRSDP